MNLVDFKITNIHEAFEECERDARALNLATCGSQVVGLIPLESILIAADYYIKRDNLMILEEDQKVKMVPLNSQATFFGDGPLIQRSLMLTGHSQTGLELDGSFQPEGENHRVSYPISIPQPFPFKVLIFIEL